MNMLSAEPPIFEKRSPREKYQVRFWSRPDLYSQFSNEVEKNDLLIQDVFNQFMEWFTDTSQQGALPKRETASK
jgi:hypothetical protein